MKIETIKNINKYQNKVILCMEYDCDNYNDTINIEAAVRNSLGLTELTVQYGNIAITKHIAVSRYGIVANISYISDDICTIDKIYSFLAGSLGEIKGFFADEKYNADEFYSSIEECGHILNELENKIKKECKECSDNKKAEREAVCIDIVNKLDEMKPSMQKDKKIIDKLNSCNTSADSNDNLGEGLKKAIDKSKDDTSALSDKNISEVDIKARCYDLIRDRIIDTYSPSSDQSNDFADFETVAYIRGIIKNTDNILEYLKTLK